MATRNVGLIWLFVTSTLCAQGQVMPPPNDNYSNRIVLTGTDNSFSGTLAAATREMTPFEVTSSFAPGSQTVWWSWTAPTSGTVIVQIFDPAPGTYRPDGLAVWKLQDIYTGLLVAGMRFDSRLPHILFTFAAEAGTNYDFQLAGSDSANFSFRLVETNAPFVIESPKSQTITAGDSVLLTVVAAGAKPFGYQWQCNGTNLDGETAPILELNDVRTEQSGLYWVVITNTAGTNVSEAASLVVTPVDIPAALWGAVSNLGSFVLGFQGEVGRRYRLQSSTTLANWNAEASFPRIFPAGVGLTNSSVVLNWTGTNSFAVPQTGRQKFFRATAFHAVNEVCNNNLKAIRFARLLAAYDEGKSANDTDTFSELRPYFKNQTIPVCPAHGTETITTILYDPTCTVHLFEEP
jgi:hypothetical protein